MKAKSADDLRRIAASLGGDVRIHGRPMLVTTPADARKPYTPPAPAPTPVVAPAPEVEPELTEQDVHGIVDDAIEQHAKAVEQMVKSAIGRIPKPKAGRVVTKRVATITYGDNDRIADFVITPTYAPDDGRPIVNLSSKSQYDSRDRITEIVVTTNFGTAT